MTSLSSNKTPIIPIANYQQKQGTSSKEFQRHPSRDIQIFIVFRALSRPWYAKPNGTVRYGRYVPVQRYIGTRTVRYRTERTTLLQ